MKISAAEIHRNLSDLIFVTPVGNHLEVEMPLVFPTGETVVVSVYGEADGYVVHDSGLAAMSLSTQGVNITKNLSSKLSSIAAHYGCEFVHGRMTRKSSVEDLAVSISIVSNASRSIGDQALYAANAPIIDFKTEALEVLRSSVGADRIRENEPVIGESGSRYTASAALLDTDGISAVGLVEPVKDHEAATKKFREFWDISQSVSYNRLHRFALYDDRREWQASDLNLLQNVCDIVRLSDAKAILN